MLERGPDRLRRRPRPEHLRELFLLTAKPFIYVFNCDADELADEDLKARDARAWSRPAEAVFLDAKFESELVELDEDEARELLAVDRAATSPASTQLARVGFDTLGLQSLPDGGPEGVPRLDDPRRAPPPPRRPA